MNPNSTGGLYCDCSRFSTFVVSAPLTAENPNPKPLFSSISKKTPPEVFMGLKL